MVILRPSAVGSMAAVMGAVLDNAPDMFKAPGRLPMPDRSMLNGAMATSSRIASRSSRALMRNGPFMLSAWDADGAAAAVPPGAVVPLRPIMDPSSEWPRKV